MGSGITGAVIARRLVEAGRRVLVVIGVHISEAMFTIMFIQAEFECTPTGLITSGPTMITSGLS